MKTRVHYAGKQSGEVARLINRLAAQGDYIYGIEDLGDQWVVFTTRDIRVETRDQIITEEVIAEAAARWDDPA